MCEVGNNLLINKNIPVPLIDKINKFRFKFLVFFIDYNRSKYILFIIFILVINIIIVF